MKLIIKVVIVPVLSTLICFPVMLRWKVKIIKLKDLSKFLYM